MIIRKASAAPWNEPNFAGLRSSKPPQVCTGKLAPSEYLPIPAPEPIFKSQRRRIDGSHKPPCRISADPQKRSPIHNAKSGNCIRWHFGCSGKPVEKPPRQGQCTHAKRQHQQRLNAAFNSIFPLLHTASPLSFSLVNTKKTRPQLREGLFVILKEAIPHPGCGRCAALPCRR